MSLVSGASAFAKLDAYTTAINTALVNRFGDPTLSTTTCNLTQLETATLACITNDLTTKKKNNATAYVNAALALRSSVVTDAPTFSLAMANLMSPVGTFTVVALQTSVAQGGIQAAPSVSGSVAGLVLYSGGAITDTVAYAKTLVAAKTVATNSAVCGQIALAIASNTAAYPIVTGSATPTDPRISLAATMMGAAPKCAQAIAQAIGQTMAIDYLPLNTINIPPYDQREQLARFAHWLGLNLPKGVDASLVAKGLIASNPEVAPRIVNDMLINNPTLAKAPDKFIQSVAGSVDAENTMEIAAAIAFGPGVNALAPTPVVTDTTAFASNFVPFLTAANSSKLAAKIAGAFAAALVTKSDANVVTDISGMEAILSNALASFATVTDPKSLSSYQKLILTVAEAASNAAKKAKLLPAVQASIAQTVAETVASAVKTVYTNTSLTDKNSLYSQLIAGLNKIAATNVTPSVTAGLAGANFAWGPLNPDETPNTNF